MAGAAAAATTMTIATPVLNLFAVRALGAQDFGGVAYTVRTATLAALDSHLLSGRATSSNNSNSNSNATGDGDTRNASADELWFPFAYSTTNYSQCYGNNGTGSCGGAYATTSASAAAYLLLAVGDPLTPQPVANIGLLGTEIFIGVELFVMVAIAVGFILIAVRLLRQVRLGDRCVGGDDGMLPTRERKRHTHAHKFAQRGHTP